MDASGLRPSRSPLGWRAAPRPPANEACRTIKASAHDSVVPRQMKPVIIVSAYQSHPRLTFFMCMHQFGVPRGNAHGGGVGGSAPDRAPRRRTAHTQHLL